MAWARSVIPTVRFRGDVRRVILSARAFAYFERVVIGIAVTLGADAALLCIEVAKSAQISCGICAVLVVVV